MSVGLARLAHRWPTKLEATRNGSTEIVAFYTLSTAEIFGEHLRSKLMSLTVNIWILFTGVLCNFVENCGISELVTGWKQFLNRISLV